MSARQHRLADLLAARKRIDQQIGRLGIDLATLPTEPPTTPVNVLRARELARHLIQTGRQTHAEVAHALGIHPDAVAGLIAATRSHPQDHDNRSAA